MSKIKSLRTTSYKKSPTRGPIAENVQAATAKFSENNPTMPGKYAMILVAAARARDIMAARPKDKSFAPNEHKATVTSLLEIEKGDVTFEYIAKKI